MITTKEDFDSFVEKNGNKNIGWRHDRMKFPCVSTEREKMFARAWRKENVKNVGLNFGQGGLQDNFINSNAPFGFCDWSILHKITKVERVIVATIIQWLGTNVGWCWLNDTLKTGGYKIVRIEKEDRP